MIEAEANEVPADLLKQAFEIGQKAIDQSCDFQSEFIKKLTIKEKEVTYNKPSDELIAYISKILTQDKLQALTGNTKVPFNELTSAYEKEVMELCKEHIADGNQSDFTQAKIKM